MFNRYAVLTALPLLLGAPSIATANLLQDGSFELPSLAATSMGYCYTAQAITPNCKGEGVELNYGRFGPWTGNLSTAVSRIGTNWHFSGASPDGVQFGILQSYSSWMQNFAVDAPGKYLLTWSDAGRADPVPGVYGGDHSYVVKMDGVVLATYSVYSGKPFTAQSLEITLATAGNHSLRFSGAQIVGDESAYIDALNLVAVPEPETYALMACGLVALGVTLRRRNPA